jgi:hypothetical protein
MATVVDCDVTFGLDFIERTERVFRAWLGRYRWMDKRVRRTVDRLVKGAIPNPSQFRGSFLA